MQKEIELELRYCYARKTGKQLFEYAKSQGKSIILVSDMYLSQEIIKRILSKNGYSGYQRLFVSNECHCTKRTGSLFDFVKKEMQQKSAASFIHVGDNIQSDYIMPKKKGWRAFLLPKTLALFQNRIPFRYSGGSFFKIYITDAALPSANEALNYLGIRCMLAVVANEIFDNPDIKIKGRSDFNADPGFFGYYVLGMYIFAMAKWLIEANEAAHYDSINFFSRDGILPKLAFDLLNTIWKQDVKTNYVYVSRKSLQPLTIKTRADLLTLASSLTNIGEQTPHSVLRLYAPVLNIRNTEQCNSFLSENEIQPNLHFYNYVNFLKFVNLLYNELYSDEKAEVYRNNVKSYFTPFFSRNCATFDVGYNLRVEQLLADLFPDTRIDAFFTHTNLDLPCNRARISNVRMHTLYDFSPYVTWAVREAFLAENAPSCIGYSDGGGVLFEEDHREADTTIIVMQKAAIQFVQDMVRIFDEDLKLLPFRITNACAPFEYFLHSGSRVDRRGLITADFENDFVRANSQISILRFWEDLQRKYKMAQMAKHVGPFLRFVIQTLAALLFDSANFIRRVRNKLKHFSFLEK